MSKYDERNQLNDLTGKEWLKLTKSFWMSEKCAEDKQAFMHPAPFLIKDIEKLISFFTKKGMTVLDPFMGSGTTSIASSNLGRRSYGIDLNPEFRELAYERFNTIWSEDSSYSENIQYVIGNSCDLRNYPEEVDYIVTSPPYHNILRNKSSGLRKDMSSKGFRSGSRIGVEYYSENEQDLGNQDEYSTFIDMLKLVMNNCFKVLKNKKYCSIIMSDFTVDKIEINVQGDIVKLMQDIGFTFVGTTVLLQDNKPLYPFGYPYAYKINHMHQNIINFRKDG